MNFGIFEGKDLKKMLTKEEEWKIGKLPADDLKRNELVEANIRIAIEEVRKFCKKFSVCDESELFSEALEALVESSRTYKDGYGKFYSYAKRNIQWRLLASHKKSKCIVNSIRHFKDSRTKKVRKQIRESWDYNVPIESLGKEEICKISWTEDDILTKIDFDRLRNSYENLTEEEKEIIIMRWDSHNPSKKNGRYTYREIGEALGMNKVVVRNREIKALNKMKNSLAKRVN